MARSEAIVDTDVHHGLEDDDDLVPYLEEAYVERYEFDGFPSGMEYGNMHLRPWITDNEIGSHETSIDATRSMLLDEYGIDAAILTGTPAYGAAAVPDTDYANALCRAFNDYTIDRWLDADDRFRYSMAVNHSDPEWSASEIRRIGDRPEIVGVLMPTSARRPFGNDRYDPIYEACTEHDLVVSHHLGGGGGVNFLPPTGAGWPSHYIENRLTRHSKYLAHLVSYVFEGTFEKFPDLQVVMLESGWGWVPWILWRMEAEWKAFRREVPWVERNPREYFADHVRFNTQPIEEPDDLEDLDTIIGWMDGDRTLVFGTDFPHHDWDNPHRTLTHLDPDLRRRIFAGNAAETYGIDV